jgi:2-polyprenyl-3-methyl-5-hydroxy-6-metoxy-1,4-benzoquinol methylase
VTTASVDSPLGEWPRDGLEHVDRCPACGSASRELLYSDLVDRSYGCAPGRWRLVRCKKCSCAYLDPRPDERTAHIAYSNYYDDAAVVHETSAPSRLRRARRALRNGYLNSHYGYALTPASGLGRVVVPFLPGHRQRADEYVRHLRRPPGEARLLDVGCGEGEFLAGMQAAGWSVEGVETSSDAVELARGRGVPVTLGTVTTMSLDRASFDAITFRLAFEHLRDPVPTLRACRRALRLGGRIWIATPNLDSEGHRRFGEHWINLQAPRHPVMYTPGSLVRLLSDTGFEVVELRSSPQAQWSFRMSAALAQGAAPFAQTLPLRGQLALGARLADLRARIRPETADVMILIAQPA